MMKRFVQRSANRFQIRENIRSSSSAYQFSGGSRSHIIFSHDMRRLDNARWPPRHPTTAGSRRFSDARPQRATRTLFDRGIRHRISGRDGGDDDAVGAGARRRCHRSEVGKWETRGRVPAAIKGRAVNEPVRATCSPLSLSVVCRIARFVERAARDIFSGSTGDLGPDDRCRDE